MRECRLISDHSRIELAHYNLFRDHARRDEGRTEYYRQLAQCLFGVDEPEKQTILALNARPTNTSMPRYHESLQETYSRVLPERKKERKIDEQCILDAPGIGNCMTSVLDWNAVSNMIGVSLSSDLYVWHEGRAKRRPYLQASLPCEERIASVLMGESHCVVIGREYGNVDVWDIERGLQIRSLVGHTGRVGALDQSGPIVSSGSDDSRIVNWDLRAREAQTVVITQQQQGAINSLKWNADGSVLAHGTDAQSLCLWSSRIQRTEVTHKTTVKALAWCPWQSNLLASGGEDRCIKFWQTDSHMPLDSTMTHESIGTLRWCTPTRELISTHGNDIVVWRYPTMRSIATLSRHEERVLGVALSPDHRTLVSASADETLRYWSIQPPIKQDTRPKHSLSHLR